MLCNNGCGSEFGERIFVQEGEGNFGRCGNNWRSGCGCGWEGREGQQRRCVRQLDRCLRGMEEDCDWNNRCRCGDNRQRRCVRQLDRCLRGMDDDFDWNNRCRCNENRQRHCVRQLDRCLRNIDNERECRCEESRERRCVRQLDRCLRNTDERNCE